MHDRIKPTLHTRSNNRRIATVIILRLNMGIPRRLVQWPTIRSWLTMNYRLLFDEIKSRCSDLARYEYRFAFSFRFRIVFSLSNERNECKKSTSNWESNHRRSFENIGYHQKNYEDHSTSEEYEGRWWSTTSQQYVQLFWRWWCSSTAIGTATRVVYLCIQRAV